MFSMFAQITNVPSAITAQLSSAAGSAYDTFITMTAISIAIGLVVLYVRRGARAKA